MTTVPLGLAIDAAIEAAGGYDLEVTTLRYCSFSMEAPTSNQRPLRATGTVSKIGRRHVETEVEVWEQNRLILRGQVGLVRVRGGRATEITDRANGPAADLAPDAR
jgi:acyl-coenzyme A thioesterase PaaI-like protein